MFSTVARPSHQLIVLRPAERPSPMFRDKSFVSHRTGGEEYHGNRTALSGERKGLDNPIAGRDAGTRRFA